MFIAVVTESEAGTVRLVVTGELDLAAAPAFRRELRAAEARLGGTPATVLVVDLAATTLIDSVGVGLLAGAARRATEAGTRLVVDGAAGAVGDLLHRTRLDEIVEVRDAAAPT